MSMFLSPVLTEFSCPVPQCTGRLQRNQYSIGPYENSSLSCPVCLSMFRDNQPGLRKYTATTAAMKTFDEAMQGRMDAAESKWGESWKDGKECPSVGLAQACIRQLGQGGKNALADAANYLWMLNARADGPAALAEAVKHFWPFFEPHDDVKDLSAVLLTEASRPHYVENDAVTAAHPLKTGRHDLYGAALCMVSERHWKGDLALLVTALLDREQRFRKLVTQTLGGSTDTQDTP